MNNDEVGQEVARHLHQVAEGPMPNSVLIAEVDAQGQPGLRWAVRGNDAYLMLGALARAQAAVLQVLADYERTQHPVLEVVSPPKLDGPDPTAR